MPDKLKIILVIVLLSVSVVIFGSYFKSNEGLEEVKKSHEREAIDFTKDILRLVKANKAREFVKKSVNPKAFSGLKECYGYLRGITPGKDPKWDVRKAPGDNMYHVFFSTPKGKRVHLMLKNDKKKWSFAYITQG